MEFIKLHFDANDEDIKSCTADKAVKQENGSSGASGL